MAGWPGGRVGCAHVEVVAGGGRLERVGRLTLRLTDRLVITLAHLHLIHVHPLIGGDQGSEGNRGAEQLVRTGWFDRRRQLRSALQGSLRR